MINILQGSMPPVGFQEDTRANLGAGFIFVLASVLIASFALGYGLFLLIF